MKAHVFRGRRYRVRVVNRLKDHADTDAPDTPGKTIRLHSSLDGQQRLQVLLDEGIHACLFDLDNEVVQEISEDLARFLWRDGWRRRSLER